MKLTHAIFIALCLIPSAFVRSQGTVYLVLGSDTGIWDGMDVGAYRCTYALSLLTDPAMNATRAMDPAFRLALKDSYGTPVKLTWWMMAGNIFRYATNTNIPTPNTMTMYLMKKYEGTGIRTWGDELTLHYHTFIWTDYDHDGKYYWNQALSFSESADDFKFTLAQMLLEEETFPVSFRSGWHAMDNGWQQTLDSLLPYSLHNDWPAKRTDVTEPLDNTYDWSRAPSTFVPFHPSPVDYQVPGAGRGWNVRSRYMSAADSTFMDKIFAAAAAGTDQVTCLWAHLPEADFLDNIRKVDSSAHKVAGRYPAVQFRYCTAVEAMQRWRGAQDTTKPRLTVVEISEGAGVRWSVSSDEPIFQPVPFVAVKDKYGEYTVAPCRTVGPQSWETTTALPRADLAKVGVAVTDTAGNLATSFIRYLPDDIYVDNVDSGYVELSGAWASTTASSWGISSRVATLGSGDSVKVDWNAPISVSGVYNVFVQIPKLANPAQQLEYRFMEDGTIAAKTVFAGGVPSGRWVYLGTRSLNPAVRNALELFASGATQSGLQVAADAVKYSSLVRNQWLQSPDVFDAGTMIVNLETKKQIRFQNEGVQAVNLTSFASSSGKVVLKSVMPLIVPAMGETTLDIGITPSALGSFNDTLTITSSDPRHAVVNISVMGKVLNYFEVVDDRDSLDYVESGAWNFSSARAYGTTSRYAYPAAGASASFHAILEKAGRYQVQEIVPITVNASVRARYSFVVNGVAVDSAFIDQNTGSGNWVNVLEHIVPAGADVRVVITDAMSPVVAGKVLRADAIWFQWMDDGTSGVTEKVTPAVFSLQQNYPNPFNPATTISYRIPGSRGYGVGSMMTKLVVFDLLGREVAVLVNERLAPGRYEVKFDASGLASGMYFYRLQAGSFVETRKLLLLR